jgi:hypothetical protein
LIVLYLKKLENKIFKMPKTKKSEIIHVGLKSNEALEGKRSILVTEKSLLTIIKAMRSYNTLRKREFVIKNRLKKAI